MSETKGARVVEWAISLPDDLSKAEQDAIFAQIRRCPHHAVMKDQRCAGCGARILSRP